MTPLFRRTASLVPTLVLLATFVLDNTLIPAPPFAVIANVSGFDSESGTMLPSQTIVIRDSLIAAIDDATQKTGIPADAIQIDGRGKFVIPGLIDAHVHVVHVLDYAHVTGDEVLPL